MRLQNGQLLTGKALSLSHVSSNMNMVSKFDLDFDGPVWNTSWRRVVTATLRHPEDEDKDEEQQKGLMWVFW